MTSTTESYTIPLLESSYGNIPSCSIAASASSITYHHGQCYWYRGRYQNVEPGWFDKNKISSPQIHYKRDNRHIMMYTSDKK